MHASDKREKLDQELTGVLETGRRGGEELRNKSRELSDENRAIPFFFERSTFLFVFVY